MSGKFPGLEHDNELADMLSEAFKGVLKQIEPMWKATAISAAHACVSFYDELKETTEFDERQRFELTLAFLGKTAMTQSGQ